MGQRSDPGPQRCQPPAHVARVRALGKLGGSHDSRGHLKGPSPATRTGPPPSDGSYVAVVPWCCRAGAVVGLQSRPPVEAVVLCSETTLGRAGSKGGRSAARRPTVPGRDATAASPTDRGGPAGLGCCSRTGSLWTLRNGSGPARISPSESRTRSSPRLSPRGATGGVPFTTTMELLGHAPQGVTWATDTHRTEGWDRQVRSVLTAAWNGASADYLRIDEAL